MHRYDYSAFLDEQTERHRHAAGIRLIRGLRQEPPTTGPTTTEVATNEAASRRRLKRPLVLRRAPSA